MRVRVCPHTHTHVPRVTHRRCWPTLACCHRLTMTTLAAAAAGAVRTWARCGQSSLDCCARCVCVCVCGVAGIVRMHVTAVVQAIVPVATGASRAYVAGMDGAATAATAAMTETPDAMDVPARSRKRAHD